MSGSGAALRVLVTAPRRAKSPSRVGIHVSLSSSVESGNGAGVKCFAGGFRGSVPPAVDSSQHLR
jgi:hypothetical protein